ncbi:hypothetical protein Aperf_G00000022313 [Anoplocephala perfoliata]
MLVWMPVDVLLPHSALDRSSNMNRLVKLLQQSEFSCNIVGVGRHSFNNQQGLEYLKSLCHPHYLPSIYAFQEKYYGLSAVSALFNYLETAKRVYYAPKSLKVEFSGSSQSTILDATSALRLGLVGRSRCSRDTQTLFNAINYTCTISGARRLRASLLEPPNDLATITYRQDSVEELITKPQILLEIQNVLTKFPAIDSLLSMCIHLSEFPTPRTDNLTAKSASAAIIASTTSILPHRPTAFSDLINEEYHLTPSSNVTDKSRQPTTVDDGGMNTFIATNVHSVSSPPASARQSSTTSGGDLSSSSTTALMSALTIEKNAELRITKLIAIKHMLDLIKPLFNALKGTSTALLKTYRDILSDTGYGELLKKMTTVLQPDVCVCRGTLQMRVQKCFAIKPGVNVLLDLTRRAYAEQVDDISRYVKDLASKCTLPLRVAYNKARGFFIQIPEQALNLPIHRRNQSSNSESLVNSSMASSSQRNSASLLVTQFSNDDRPDSQGGRSLPSVFIKVQVAKDMINCTTDEMVKLNERIKGSLNEVYLIADNLVCKLIHDLHPEMSLFYRLSEVVSGLDLLCSLARIVVSAPSGHIFVKPVFGDTLAIHEGRHMIKDRFSGTPPVSNNTFASASQNVSIILGTSMSGKTTYLIQVALMQILAQIGAFVPAKFAAFKLMDKIFARMGCRDDMTTNASTFALEMREVGHVFRSATDNSLILIDDLGLSTTDEDCFSLSFAICDALAKMRAFSFFTSSDAALTQLQFHHLNIEICHFEVKTQGLLRDGNCLPQMSFDDESFFTAASLTFSGSFRSTESESAKVGSETRIHSKYTYRLKRGAGEETHSIVDQLTLTALDPTFIALTKKYFDILVSEKTTKRREISTAGINLAIGFDNPLDGCSSSSKRSRLGDNSPTDNEIPYPVFKGADKSASQPSSKNESFAIPLGNETAKAMINVDIDAEESSSGSMASKTPEINQSSKKEASKNTVTEGEIAENGREALDGCEERKGYTTVDRLAHCLTQQIQMLACVVKCVDRVSSSAPPEGCILAGSEDQPKIRAVQQSTLSHLAFLRDRYAGVMQNLMED